MSSPVPGGAADGTQIPLLEAACARAAQGDIVVFRKIERSGGKLGLRVQPLIIGAGAVIKRHIAPVFYGLGAFNTQACFQHQHRITLAD
ncbi:hypothetical protein D3C77_731550 [compost metagenome]